jgi:hypothetical protein
MRPERDGDLPSENGLSLLNSWPTFSSSITTAKWAYLFVNLSAMNWS